MENSALPIFFQITSIEHGWFFAELVTPTGNLSFANAYLGGLGLPRAFLHSLILLLNGSSATEWICWHAESYAHIWKMSTHENAIRLGIYRIESYVNLSVHGEGLADRVRFAEPEQTLDADKDTFVRSVCNAFKEYRTVEGLDRWNDSGFEDFFPTEEYQMLRRFLRNH